MANKIIVTTDLSNNAKAGIRFAIQLASQNLSPLIFYQVIDLKKPTRWSEDKFQFYAKEQLSDANVKLNRLVREVYKQSGLKPGKYECIVRNASTVGEDVIQYAVKIKAAFICMGTRGAGRIRRIWGTNTSFVLTHSPIPVFAVPQNYRRTPVTHILYSSDLDHLRTELQKVKKFADSIKAKVSVLHYDYQLEEVQAKLHKVARQHKAPGVQFYFEKLSMEDSLDTHLMKAIRRNKPSLVVLFTKQNRDWYERLFLSSKSAEVSFDTKKPLLIFPKKSK